jgi:hypothetical protein
MTERIDHVIGPTRTPRPIGSGFAHDNVAFAGDGQLGISKLVESDFRLGAARQSL